MGDNEDELIRGIRGNDSRVLSQFYAEQFPTVRSFVLRNSGNSSDAQDVFQEAMMAAWLNLKENKYSSKEGGKYGAYVYRIAKNKWLDRLRSAEHRNVNNIMSEVSDRISEITEEESTSERIDYLQSIYAQLDEKCRQILDKFYYEKKSLEAIAKDLKYDVGSIRTMKYRCMMKLRKRHAELKKIDLPKPRT